MSLRYWGGAKLRFTSKFLNSSWESKSIRIHPLLVWVWLQKIADQDCLSEFLGWKLLKFYFSENKFKYLDSDLKLTLNENLRKTYLVWWSITLVLVNSIPFWYFLVAWWIRIWRAMRDSEHSFQEGSISISEIIMWKNKPS